MLTTARASDLAAGRTSGELVAAVAAGERLALGWLYARFAPNLLLLARRVAWRGTEAEDLVHDVFIEVARLASGYDPTRGSVET